MTFLIIILTLVGAAILLYVITAILSVTTPPEKTGPLYLRQQLENKGVQSYIPEGCINELVAQSIMIARARSADQNKKFHLCFIEVLDEMVFIIITWLDGIYHPMQEIAPCIISLKKYSVPFGGNANQ
jgi:hypothetical protein